MQWMPQAVNWLLHGGGIPGMTPFVHDTVALYHRMEAPATLPHMHGFDFI